MTRLPIIERPALDELVRLLAAHPRTTCATYHPERCAWTLMTGGYGKRNQRKAINLGPSFDVTTPRPRPVLPNPIRPVRR